MKKVFVAGHTGLIGSAVSEAILKDKKFELVTSLRADLDLNAYEEVRKFFDLHRPDYVVLAAGRVGGILENKNFPFDFITSNLSVQLNAIRAAVEYDVERTILFGSSCMYPKHCDQPMREDQLLTGKPEVTSISYAISKLAGVELCSAYNREFKDNRFLPLIPNSVYGPNDNFDPSSGHVLSSLIKKFHEAKVNNVNSISLWGSGNPRREFLFSRDLAEIVINLLDKNVDVEDMPLNVGVGFDHSIKELSEIIKSIIGFQGEVTWDDSKPDGAMQKLLDSTRIQKYLTIPKTDLVEGIHQTYQWFLDNEVS